MREPDEYNAGQWNEVTYVREAKPLPGVAEAGASAVGNAFAEQPAGSPWDTSTPAAPVANSTLQAAADGAGKAF